MNRREAAGLTGLLTDIGEFLRTPGTRVLLEALYRDQRGSASPENNASVLTDWASFTLYCLQHRAAAADRKAAAS